MKKHITEEMGIHKEWKAEAKTIKSVEALAVFVDRLINEYEHDYGTIVHAISAGMLATMHVINESDEGGITGFQASCIGWEMISEFFGKHPLGARILDYNDLLYPQYDFKFNSISKTTFEKIIEQAKKNLEERPDAHPNVLAHWKFVAEGGIPFNLKIEED